MNNNVTTMTREEIERLSETNPMPDKNGLKLKVKEEVFIAPNGEANDRKALNVLKRTQFLYQQQGWRSSGDDKDSGVFQDTDGKWYAYRHQALYK